MPSLINSWPEWTRLYWLFCLPVVLLLLWGLHWADKQQHDWYAWLPRSFHAILLSKNTNQQRRSRYLLLGSAWLCAIFALLGPSWEQTLQQPSNQQYGSPLVIAIQLTPDMLANDLAPNRLDRIRAKVLNLLEQRSAAFTALVVYAGSAHTLVPLSNDLLTSKNLLKALQPDLMPVAGQRADLAIERAVHLLEQGAQDEGQVLLISTGVSVPEQTAIKALLKQHPIQLKIIGVGTTTGAPIVDPVHGHFITDASGAIIISRLNAVSLQLLSKHTNSPYALLNNEDSDLDTLGILTQVSSNLTTEAAERSIVRHDQGYWFILPLLLLFAYFARRGGLLLLLVVCMLPIPSFAFEFDNLWLRPDQQGQRLLEQQQPSLAAQHFNDPLWRATALYLAADYTAAAELFAHFDNPETHYNRGNALALAGLLPEAIQAYQQALAQDPSLLAAQFNLSVIQDALNNQQADPINEQTVGTQEPSTSGLSDPLSAIKTTTAIEDATTTQGGPEPAASSTASPIVSDLEQDLTIQAQAPLQPPSPDSTLAEPPIHLESWLEQIPDNPSELLKRKFWYEHNMQETTP